jgi:hypothetical protein
MRASASSVSLHSGCPILCVPRERI